MKAKVMAGIAFALIANNATADNSLEVQYKTNFTALIEPQIKQRLQTTKAQKLSIEEIDKLAHSQAAQMANCQYQSLQHYPDKYKKLSIGYIASGVDVTDTNRKLTTEIINAIDTGELTKPDFKSFMEKAIASFESCIDGHG